MNARYYLPGLARFASPDPLIPDPANSQQLNRYSYVLNNPLQFTDPSGHCPAPISDNGYSGNRSVICLAGFIPTAYSQGPPGIIFEGDNRDFSSNSPLDGSRFWIWIDTSSGEIIHQYIHPTVTVEDFLCSATVCSYDPLSSFFNNISSSVLENGTIHISYSILCSHPTCLLGPGPDGWIDFIPDGEGRFRTAGSVEQFPDLEAYLWNNGQLDATLFQHQFFSVAERASGIALFFTGFWMVGGPGQHRYWNIPSRYPHITIPDGNGGGDNPPDAWNPLFQ